MPSPRHPHAIPGLTLDAATALILRPAPAPAPALALALAVDLALAIAIAATLNLTLTGGPTGMEGEQQADVFCVRTPPGTGDKS